MNGPLDVIVVDGLVTLTLNRPTALNAFDRAMAQELRRTFEAMSDDDGVRAVVVTGAGRGFCAGLDVREMQDESGVATDLGALLRADFHPMLEAIRRAKVPVVAAVNGVAAGAGLGLACACDIRVAAASATFRSAWSKVGLVPDLGAGYLLPRLIGHGRAYEIVASGRVLDATEALDIGLASHVWADAEFPSRWKAYATDLAAGATVALGLAKAELAASWDLAPDDHLALEADLQFRASQSSDHREGIAAFREKRPPRFTGH